MFTIKLINQAFLMSIFRSLLPPVILFSVNGLELNIYKLEPLLLNINKQTRSPMKGDMQIKHRGLLNRSLHDSPFFV